MTDPAVRDPDQPETSATNMLAAAMAQASVLALLYNALIQEASDIRAITIDDLCAEVGVERGHVRFARQVVARGEQSMEFDVAILPSSGPSRTEVFANGNHMDSFLITDAPLNTIAFVFSLPSDAQRGAQKVIVFFRKE